MIGSTLIITNQGNVDIATIALNPTNYKVLSYDIDLNIYSWEDIDQVNTNLNILCDTVNFVTSGNFTCDPSQMIFVFGQGFVSMSTVSSLAKVGTFNNFDLVISKDNSVSNLTTYSLSVVDNKTYFANGYFMK